MPWEARLLVPGASVYVDGVFFISVGYRERVGTGICAPYVGLQGDGAPPDGLGVLETTVGPDDGSGVPVTVWWVSHLRVAWDAPPPDRAARHPSQRRAR